ncbi:anti-sigma factor antagonist [Nocardia sp. NPDC003979]
MSPRPLNHDDRFSAFADEPPDPCTRLRAELDVRTTVVILSVHGEVDAYTLQHWHHLLDTALAEASRAGLLIVDIGDLAFIGCRPILDLAAEAQQAAMHGIRIVVLNPVPSVAERVITVAGLTQWLPLHTSLTDALIVNAPRLHPVCMHGDDDNAFPVGP